MLALRKHKLNAWFGQESLRDADPNIQITNISRTPSIRTGSRDGGGRDGRFRAPQYRDYLKITIEFTLYDFLDIEARESAIEAANAWARDAGYLQISQKPGRRVWVQCAQRAEIQDARDHKETFQLVFETAENPFWEDAFSTAFAFSGAAAATTAHIPGTRACSPADVTVTPTGGALATLTLTLGETQMAFAGLNVASGASLLLRHDDQGRLTITGGGASCYACREGASDDELIAGPGRAAIGFTANVACNARFEVRGRYK